MESHNMLRLQVKVKLLMKSQKLSAIEGIDD
jgi:beta-N-acetylglucosaminidase